MELLFHLIIIILEKLGIPGIVIASAIIILCLTGVISDKLEKRQKKHIILNNHKAMEEK